MIRRAFAVLLPASIVATLFGHEPADVPHLDPPDHAPRPTIVLSPVASTTSTTAVATYSIRAM